MTALKEALDKLDAIRGDIERLAEEHGEALMPLEEKVKDLSDSIDTVAKDMEDLERRVQAIEDTYITVDALDTKAPSTHDLLSLINELQEHIARNEGGAVGMMFTTNPR
jgi:predicted  nucleic acid-binding Zn-ribbon protein